MKAALSVLQVMDKLSLREGKFLVAFSGGPDSVYLLLSLAEFYSETLSDHIALCYVDYHDSPWVPEEEKVVNFYQRKYSLPLFRKDVQHQKEDRNFEDWARQVRYSFFAEVAEKKHYDGVLVAHQKTDSVETYLLQKERNNLPLHYGLQEMARLGNLKVIRPLLSVTKRVILNALDEAEDKYYDDKTNLHTTRARLRKELSEEKIQQLEGEIQQANRKLSALYKSFSLYPSGMPFSTYDSLSQEEAKRYLFYLLDAFSISEDRREGAGKEAFDFLQKRSAGVLPLDSSYSLYRAKTYFFVSRNLSSISYSYTITEEGEVKTPFFTINVKKEFFHIPSFPFVIRSYQQGDKLGTDLPEKDVATFLKKQGIPSFLLPIYPVFEKDERIFYVPFRKDIEEKKIPFTLHLSQH